MRGRCRLFEPSAATDSFVPFAVGQQTVVFPGFDGGAEWGGPAVDPKTGVLYVNANEMAWTGGLEKTLAHATARRGDLQRAVRDLPWGESRGIAACLSVADRSHRPAHKRSNRGHCYARTRTHARPAEHRRVQDCPLLEYLRTGVAQTSEHSGDLTPGGPGVGYSFTGYRKFLDPDGYPAITPPWGTLSAIDLNTGKYLWQIPLGEYPALAAQGMKNTGIGELWRSDRDGGWSALHRRDGVRPQISRVRREHGKAAVGGNAAVRRDRNAGDL